MDVLNDAMALHRLINDRLKTAIRNPATADPASIKTDRLCEFGVWIYGEGYVRYGATAEFRALQQTHQQFHHAAYMALCLCRGGKREEAEQSITTGDFHHFSEEMISRLKTMQQVAAASRTAKVCETVAAPRAASMRQKAR